MKTIKAIFTTKKLDDPRMREYSFNTEMDVKVGDLLQSPDYHGKLLQVTGIENEVYSHFSFRTGELKKMGGAKLRTNQNVERCNCDCRRKHGYRARRKHYRILNIIYHV